MQTTEWSRLCLEDPCRRPKSQRHVRSFFSGPPRSPRYCASYTSSEPPGKLPADLEAMPRVCGLLTFRQVFDRRLQAKAHAIPE